MVSVVPANAVPGKFDESSIERGNASRHRPLFVYIRCPVKDTTTERLGRYQLLEPVGMGPCGTVSRAKVFGVAGFERQFAVKRFHPELTITAALAQALSAAARAYGSLEHPRIARMSEFGVAQGQTFTAVEFVSGLDALRLVAEAKLAGTTIAAGGALALVSQAARAVGYAHGRGLVHLGIAPTNVIVTSDGDVKITDFSILAAGLPQRPVDVARLTHRIQYLAPEQLANEAVSAATDVFSLGVIAYELVTGNRTFRGETPQQIAQSIMSGPPAEPSLPRPIVRVLQRCLARSPFERFPDARALADALDAALRVAPVPGTRKDVGAMVKQTLDRLAALHEGEMSGVVALNMGTGRIRREEPIQEIATLGRDSQIELATNQFVRPDAPVAGPAPLIGPATALPDVPRPILTMTGLPPPPIPVPPGVAQPPIPPPPLPGGPSTPLGMPRVSRVSSVPQIKPRAGDPGSDGTPVRSSGLAPIPKAAAAPLSRTPISPLARVGTETPISPLARVGTETPTSPLARVGTEAPTTVDAPRMDLLFPTDEPEPKAEPEPDLERPETAREQDDPPTSPTIQAPPSRERDAMTGEGSPSLQEVLAETEVNGTSERALLGEENWRDRAPSELADRHRAPSTTSDPLDLSESFPSRAVVDSLGEAPAPIPPPPRSPPVTPPRSPSLTSPPAEKGEKDEPDEQPPPASRPVAPTKGRAPLIIAAAVIGAGLLGIGGWQLLKSKPSRGGAGSKVVTPPANGRAIAKTPADAATAVAQIPADAATAVARPPADAATAVARPPADAATAVAQVPADATRLATTSPSDAAVPAVQTSDTLTITSKPAGAHVFLDGSDSGTTPLKLPGSADRHTLALLLAGHDLYVAQVDGHGVFSIPLKEVTPSSGPAGIKVIKCKDKDRHYVFVDGKPTGQMCPTERIGTDVGPHTVEIYDAVSDARKTWDIVVKDTRLSYRVKVE